MVDAWCASYAQEPRVVTLDIDDTVDVAHGHQQLSLFNAHHDERCFQPIHIYDTATGRPVTSLQTPSPKEIYAKLYCARGQAENLIKLHKSQLKSDRTSCHSPLAIRCA